MTRTNVSWKINRKLKRNECDKWQRSMIIWQNEYQIDDCTGWRSQRKVKRNKNTYCLDVDTAWLKETSSWRSNRVQGFTKSKKDISRQNKSSTRNEGTTYCRRWLKTSICYCLLNEPEFLRSCANNFVGNNCNNSEEIWSIVVNELDWIEKRRFCINRGSRKTEWLFSAICLTILNPSK